MGTFNWTSEPLFQSRISDSGIAHNLGWNLGPEDLIHIQEHWLMYPEPDKSLHLLLGMVYVFFFIAAMIGNGLVLWIFITAKSLRTASNMFVVNLAFCDFMMMLKAPVFLYNSFHYGFALGHTGCQIFAGMGSLSGIGAGMTNAAIGYDRYTTITRPFDGKLTRTKALLIILFIWAYTIPWTVLPAMEIWGRFAPEGFLTACSFDYLTRTFDNRLFIGTIFTFSYVIPMLMIIYFYSQIVGKVFSHEKALRDQAKKMNVESLRANQQQNAESAEMKIAKAAITICFLYVVSWTPYAVLSLIGGFGDQSLLTPGVSMIPALNCKLVACIDPYIYAISHPKFRIELQKKLPWLAIKEKDISDTQSAVTENSAAPNPAT
ncbi:opsin, ultraviolet-sensitive-like isoform X2 [Anthonomus grandis grandis]|uniref:opsin, ultraviolet-sensitive-like isoform X2 n=1 Tax=Anthonomus grandis grandis TaxID=2921223 RepID=UPI00216672A2|nr:opsin, ultraviolet-sensitive-like isoform X2 [Anthonomus grandis grandis]